LILKKLEIFFLEYIFYPLGRKSATRGEGQRKTRLIEAILEGLVKICRLHGHLKIETVVSR